MRQDFTYTKNQNPHAVRSREILKKYPVIKKWMKPYPMTAFWITVLNLIQLGTGFAIVKFDLGWVWTFVLAYTVGALSAHGLFVLIHEACHDAIFKKKVWNKFWGIFCNVGQGLPSAMGFRTFHLLHHSHLNEYDGDADLAFKWEADLVKNIWWRKIIWFLFFFLIEAIRPNKLKKGKTFDRWVFANIAFVVAVNVLIYKFIGPMALWYILLSSFFSVGLHPVGARWVQEHYTYREGQETYGYYGWLNKVQFNIGFHNEHHDFYRVPWIHLPKIKELAPEYYDHLFFHKSWTKLILDFIFNPERDLYLRIVRDRGQEDRNQGEGQTPIPRKTPAVTQAEMLQ
ncbi:MAG: fatty acid desaturase [Halobacteriovoraceae bacterium]|nr:fatty acid desaturase [Halobacteriovoraceae bacterium]